MKGFLIDGVAKEAASVYSVLEAVQLPAGISYLCSGLSNMDRHGFSLK